MARFRTVLASAIGLAALGATPGSAATVTLNNFDLLNALINTPTLYASNLMDVGLQILTPGSNAIDIHFNFLPGQAVTLVDPVANAGDNERGGFLFFAPTSSGGTGNITYSVQIAYTGEINSAPDPTGLDLVTGVPCGVGIGGTCAFGGNDRTEGTMSYTDIHFHITVTNFGGLSDFRFQNIALTAAGDSVAVGYVPEPATLGLLGAALAGLGAAGWRRRKPS
ncbi:MAG: PEP-CTERM sorting domain-containing protein [Alphaproteobacteria bacterium]|nr:PEP-CTERM sorting domain-containing protein [Alphaproteobacteria bacterium]